MEEEMAVVSLEGRVWDTTDKHRQLTSVDAILFEDGLIALN